MTSFELFPKINERAERTMDHVSIIQGNRDMEASYEKSDGTAELSKEYSFEKLPTPPDIKIKKKAKVAPMAARKDQASFTDDYDTNSDHDLKIYESLQKM